MKKRICYDIIRILVLVVAFSLMLYPVVSNYLYEKNSSKVISNYDEQKMNITEEQKQKQLDDARKYNNALLSNIELLDPFSAEKSETDEWYESLLNEFSSGMMGYIRIPKINVELPIYHGTSEAVLQAGVGHFQGTSLPVGGKSSHTVLTGHRGLPSKKLFTDIDKMKIGDVFYIKILDETFAYQVDQIVTVLPTDTKELQIVPGEDLATLVTCTPYAINTHRLLVRGHRIDYEDAIKISSDEHVNVQMSFQMKILIVAISILLIILLIIVTTAFYKKLKEKKKNQN